MKPFRLISAVVLGQLLTLGCSADDGGPLPKKMTASICDGEPAVRLVLMVGDGGPEAPGARVYKENGIRYLLVDGHCQFWSLSHPWYDVRSGTLSQSQADSLATELRLSQWGNLQQRYVHGGWCDGPSSLFRFGETRLTIEAACGLPDTAGSVEWLEAAATDQMASIHSTGAAVDGPVRFLLTAEQLDVEWSIATSQRALVWPLDIDPATITVPFLEAANYIPGNTRYATAPDADLLRNLRRVFVGSGGTSYTGGFIAVTGPNDQRFQLFVRDSIALEDPTGLLFHLY